MATMVVQLGLATMPLGMERSSAALASGTTRGTSGSMRHAEELSITMAPAATNRGASTRETEAGAEHSARSIPERSAVSASSTTTSPSPHGSVEPAERAEARYRMDSTGKWRSARMARRTTPTCPVAPTMAIRIGQLYGTAACPPVAGPSWRSDLERPAPLERAPQRQLVGVLEVAADGEPAGQP